MAEVVHGAPSRFSDPAWFSFAHGGKDGHPFPVPLKTYDESLSVLRRALDRAKLGDSEKIDGFKRLDKFTRTIEQKSQPTANFDEAIAHEHAISRSIGGRTVMDDKPKKAKVSRKQLFLFSVLAVADSFPTEIFFRGLTKHQLNRNVLNSVRGIQTKNCRVSVSAGPCSHKRSAVMANLSLPKIGRSIGAVLAGILAVIILSIGTDLVLHAIGILPGLGEPVSDSLLLLATVYRTIYSVVGSYITAWLAPIVP